jgi:hypothetical protein
MERNVDILVLGTGSLARNFVYALASSSNASFSVHILGRSLSVASEIEQVAQMRATVSQRPSRFSSGLMSWDDLDEAAQILDQLKPRLIVHAASLQSPWALERMACRWAQLVKQAGFGITLPLQTYLLLYLNKAIRLANLDSIIVNASYPDWVNMVMVKAGLPILCGVGNIAILESSCKTKANIHQGRNIRLVAHHYHLANLYNRDESHDPPRIWLDEDEVNDRHSFLNHIAQVKGREINAVTGALAAHCVARILINETFNAHVPGPNGLPGGYPVIVSGRKIQINLPRLVSLQEAVEWNRLEGLKDGVCVDSEGAIEFSDRAVSALRKVSSELPGRFQITELTEVANAFLRVRSSLQLPT